MKNLVITRITSYTGGLRLKPAPSHWMESAYFHHLDCTSIIIYYAWQSSGLLPSNENVRLEFLKEVLYSPKILKKILQ